MTQVTKLKITFWNVKEIGGVDRRNRIRPRYVLGEVLSGDWDVIGLISVHRAALTLIEKEANGHGFDLAVSTVDISPDRTNARTRHTVMLVRKGLRVLKHSSTLRFADVRKRRNGVAEIRDGLVLSAAGVILDVDPEPLAIVAIYTPQHEHIDYQSPGSMSQKSSGRSGKRRIYTPQQSSKLKRETASDLAVWWTNEFAGEGAYLLVGGDWNLMSDPSRVNQDRRPDIARAGCDESGRGWVQLLQSGRDPVHPTFPYTRDRDRSGRYIDQVFCRHAQGVSAALTAAPPPKINHMGVDHGYASDHARLCVTVGNSSLFSE